MTRLCASALILDSDRRVLLVHQTAGEKNWELPGGYGKPREAPDRIAVREVSEELGLRIKPRALGGIYLEPSGDCLHFVFLCDPAGSIAKAKPDPKEVSECATFSPRHLPRPISDFTVRRVRDGLRGGTGPLPVVVPARHYLR